MGRGTRHINGKEILFKGGIKESSLEENKEAEKFEKARQEILKEKQEKEDTPDLIDEDGTKRWFNDEGKTHRDYDLPAIIYADGAKEWYQNGKEHRDGDLPAYETPEGGKQWYQHGKLHRDGGPAMINPEWFSAWYQNDLMHRDDGPAKIFNSGREEWYKHGKLHREDGPAVERPEGEAEYWLEDIRYDSKEEYEIALVSYKEDKEAFTKAAADLNDEADESNIKLKRFSSDEIPDYVRKAFSDTK